MKMNLTKKRVFFNIIFVKDIYLYYCISVIVIDFERLKTRKILNAMK
jgi:hypothetical protein